MNENMLKQWLKHESASVENIPLDGSIEKAAALILTQVHEKGGKVVVSGMGKAGQIGLNIATTLSSSGTPAVFLHPAEAQHGDLGLVQTNDIMLLVSNSGKTREVLELEYLVKNLRPDIKILAITGNPDGELCKVADVTLFTGHPKEMCPLGLTPTTSTTVMTVIGNLLVAYLMVQTKFDYTEYAKRHHSGYLGQKARESSENK
ncbi:MAG TPA: iron dicitrate transport regulator FecR [Bacteroidales bacterium]|nr:iron dicitrate transport regulator FecR [Bacteroidales bacterium]